MARDYGQDPWGSSHSYPQAVRVSCPSHDQPHFVAIVELHARLFLLDTVNLAPELVKADGKRSPDLCGASLPELVLDDLQEVRHHAKRH